MSVFKNCRSCRSDQISKFLSLGKTPLANSLLSQEQLSKPEPVYPLELAFCSNCSLVQLIETVPPEELFSDYLYFSSFSEEMVNHSREIAERLTRDKNLTADSLAVEIASNDGYLLQFYQKAGIPVLGIEPAENIARIAREEKNIPTIAEFFGTGLATRLRQTGKLADTIHANNVMAHVPDINGFVHGISLILKPEGVAVIEVPYVIDMVEKCEFDTIYHEHVFYFSVTALDKLFKKHDLLVNRIEKISLHGGSLRLFVVPMSEKAYQEKSVLELIEHEKKIGADKIAYYENLSKKIQQLRSELVLELSQLKRAGKSIAAYGASAKGSTLLNHFGIGHDVIDFVVDRSTYKQGRWTPGTHIPIRDPSVLLEKRPDYLLLLTWNFASEILAQQSEYRKMGGKFIIPLPHPHEI
ncbi:MAG: class I SAM-dependent methyltransferase [Myxococcaceae bacterium]